MTTNVEYPEMRNEVAAALRSLADFQHQHSQWGRYEEGVNYYDDLTLVVNILYDDCEVLPDPSAVISTVIHASEVPVFLALEAELGPLIDALGDRPDRDYTSDPRWPYVVSAARRALAAMEKADDDHG